VQSDPQAASVQLCTPQAGGRNTVLHCTALHCTALQQLLVTHRSACHQLLQAPLLCGTTRPTLHNLCLVRIRGLVCRTGCVLCSCNRLAQFLQLRLRLS
jgi:hypothetical protein